MKLVFKVMAAVSVDDERWEVALRPEMGSWIGQQILRLTVPSADGLWFVERVGTDVEFVADHAVRPGERL